MQDDNLWRGIAFLKWGDKALRLSIDNQLVGLGRWFQFCQHRICLRRNECAPLQLLFTTQGHSHLQRSQMTWMPSLLHAGPHLSI